MSNEHPHLHDGNFDASYKIGNLDISHAADGNLGHKRKDGTPLRTSNDDRSGVYTVGECKNPKAFLRECMNKAENLCFSQKSEGSTGTTATFAIFDPKAYTINVLSRGDSPAYLLFSDGKEKVQVRISSNIEDRDDGQVTNVLSHEDLKEYMLTDKSALETTYALTNRWFSARAAHDTRHGKTGTIDLRALTDEVCKKHPKLDKKNLSLSMVVATDGINPLIDHETKGKTLANIIDWRVERSKMKDPKYAAHIVNAAKEEDSRDNISAIVLRNLRPSNDHPPILAAVCDGFGPHGGKYATLAMQGVEQCVAEHKGKHIADFVAEHTAQPADEAPGEPKHQQRLEKQDQALGKDKGTPPPL